MIFLCFKGFMASFAAYFLQAKGCDRKIQGCKFGKNSLQLLYNYRKDLHNYVKMLYRPIPLIALL
jgi:hypothetical protein